VYTEKIVWKAATRKTEGSARPPPPLPGRCVTLCLVVVSEAACGGEKVVAGGKPLQRGLPVGVDWGRGGPVGKEGRKKEEPEPEEARGSQGGGGKGLGQPHTATRVCSQKGFQSKTTTSLRRQGAGLEAQSGGEEGGRAERGPAGGEVVVWGPAPPLPLHHHPLTTTPCRGRSPPPSLPPRLPATCLPPQRVPLQGPAAARAFVAAASC